LIASYNAVTYAVFGAIRNAAAAAGSDRVERARAMLRAYFAALQREPRSARVFLVEIRGVSRAVDKAFDASLRAIGAEIGRLSGAEADDADPLLQAGIVGGVIHIALRWIEDDYTPDIDSVTDSAMRLVMVEAKPVLARS
jgi:glycine/D-amino acid oxidase-like deaminating enzyme